MPWSMSFPVAAATHASKGAVLTDFRGLQRAGAVAVTDDGRPILRQRRDARMPRG